MLAVGDANPRPAGRCHYIHCCFDGRVSHGLKDNPSTIGREVALIKVVLRVRSDFLHRRFCISRLLKNYSPCSSFFVIRKACVERISSRIICSVICRRRRVCGRIIRCVRSGAWWTKFSRNFRDVLTACTPGSGAAVKYAGEAVTGAVAANAVLDPERAIADGRDGLQPAVPLVRGAERQDDEVWDATSFTKNRDRLLEADVAKKRTGAGGRASAGGKV